MTDISLIFLFTLAIGIGFFLGRRPIQKIRLRPGLPFSPDKSYFQGLNYLLNEQPDKAVEAFVQSLDVNSYTLETHLSLGKLMRKQGQVDRAIRIHQNLLARPQLDLQGQHQVHLELARDFMSAGLLDRAEALLQEVIAESAVLRSIAQRYLMEIYQDESEWQDAIDVAQSVLQSKYMKANAEARKEIQRMIVHFYCELAEENMAGNDENRAREMLDRAASIDKAVLRVVLLTASNDNAQGKYKQTIKMLSRFEAQNPAWFSLCLPILQQAYIAQYDDQGFELFGDHLRMHVANHRATPVVIFLVDQLLSKINTQPEYLQQARDVLSGFIRQHDSLTASSKLVELNLAMRAEDSEQDVVNLQRRVRELLDKRNLYQCGNCGFAGRQLHWRCPSCKNWDSMRWIDDPKVV